LVLDHDGRIRVGAWRSRWKRKSAFMWLVRGATLGREKDVRSIGEGFSIEVTLSHALCVGSIRVTTGASLQGQGEGCLGIAAGCGASLGSRAVDLWSIVLVIYLFICYWYKYRYVGDLYYKSMKSLRIGLWTWTWSGMDSRSMRNGVAWTSDDCGP
jgi:hypothetical protein